MSDHFHLNSFYRPRCASFLPSGIVSMNPRSGKLNYFPEFMLVPSPGILIRFSRIGMRLIWGLRPSFFLALRPMSILWVSNSNEIKISGFSNLAPLSLNLNELFLVCDKLQFVFIVNDFYNKSWWWPVHIYIGISRHKGDRFAQISVIYMQDHSSCISPAETMRTYLSSSSSGGTASTLPHEKMGKNRGVVDFIPCRRYSLNNRIPFFLLSFRRVGV
jgi:hypothetical protein